MSSWSDVAVALSGKHPRRALELALACWRARPSAMAARIVEAIAARVEVAPLPPADKTYHDEWLARARRHDVADLGVLLKGLKHGQLYGPPRWMEPVMQRLDALAELPDDPRFLACLELGAREIFGAGRPEPYEALFALARKAPDERTRAAVQKLLDEPARRSMLMRSVLRSALPPLAAALANAPKAVDDDFGELPETLGLVDEARPAGGDELLAAALADPADDAARQVYGDWLVERGDPRGELIALQFAQARGDAKPADDKRVVSLVRKHGKEWIGPLLTAVFANVRFEKGFLASASLQKSAAVEPNRWLEAASLPALATLRRLDKGRGNETHYQRFVTSPVMRALEDVEIPTYPFLDALVAGPTAKTIRTLRFGRVPNAASLARLASFPALDELAVSGAGQLVERLEGTALLARLRRVTVFGWGATEFATLAATPRLAPAETAVVWGPSKVVARAVDGRLAVEAELDAQGVGALVTILGALPPLAALTVRATDEPPPLFAEVLARHRGAKLALPTGWRAT